LFPRLFSVNVLARKFSIRVSAQLLARFDPIAPHHMAVKIERDRAEGQCDAADEEA